MPRYLTWISLLPVLLLAACNSSPQPLPEAPTLPAVVRTTTGNADRGVPTLKPKPVEPQVTREIPTPARTATIPAEPSATIPPQLAATLPQLTSVIPAGAQVTSVLTVTIRPNLPDVFVAYQLKDPQVGFPQAYIKLLLATPNGYQPLDLGTVGDDQPADMRLEDVTGDSVPEVIVMAFVGAHGERGTVFHWDETAGRYLKIGDTISGSIGLDFRDLDQDGVKEMIVSDDAPGTAHAQGVRWPVAFRWNGQKYVRTSEPQLYDEFLKTATQALTSQDLLDRSALEAAVGRALTLQGKNDEAKKHYDQALQAYQPGNSFYGPNDDPLQLVQNYYQALNSQDVVSAYQMLSPEMQARQSFADYASGFANTISADLVNNVAPPDENGLVQVAVLGVDMNGKNDPQPCLFEGSWKPKKAGDPWKMDQGQLKETPLSSLKTITARPDQPPDQHLDAAGPVGPLKLAQVIESSDALAESLMFGGSTPKTDAWLADDGNTLIVWFYGDPASTPDLKGLPKGPDPWVLDFGPYLYYPLPPADGGFGLVFHSFQPLEWTLHAGSMPGEVQVGLPSGP